MNLGENILNLRRKFNLSQEMLSEKIGVSRQTISNWELGETSPNPDQLKLLSKTFNVSVDELLDNDINGVLVEKVSNTEKLAGIIIKILKVIGLLFIILFIIDIVALIIFSITKMNNKVSVENTDVSLVCYLNDEEYKYFISYDSDDLILEHNGSEFIDNILKDKDIEKGTSMVKFIKNYFENNNGYC